jgi:hypothetical protein
MVALTAPELLDVWERCLTQGPIERLLTLLAAAGCGSLAEAAQLSVGRRDARLLTLREGMFGSRLAALESCPQCGNKLELNFSVADVRVEIDDLSDESWPLSIAEFELRCRAVNSADLIAIAGERDPAHAKRMLLERCLSDIKQGKQSIEPGQLPEEVISAVASQLQEIDPLANLQLALECPQCSRRWLADFEIGSFLWEEIHAWAQRILREVHALASVYGWRESEILAMSPLRRQFYLQCIDQ